MTRMTSVACRAIPLKDGNGAVGCGKGWTQPEGGSLSCPTCNRPLHITGRWLTITLRTNHRRQA